MTPFENCPVCGGEMVAKEVERLLRGDVNTAVLRVPAKVCLRCGERIYSQEVVRCFERIRAKLKRQETTGFQPLGQAFQVMDCDFESLAKFHSTTSTFTCQLQFMPQPIIRTDAGSRARGIGVSSRPALLSSSLGNHHIYAHPEVPELVNLKDIEGEAKPYQVKQLLNIIERYNLYLEDEE